MWQNIKSYYRSLPAHIMQCSSHTEARKPSRGTGLNDVDLVQQRICGEVPRQRAVKNAAMRVAQRRFLNHDLGMQCQIVQPRWCDRISTRCLKFIYLWIYSRGDLLGQLAVNLCGSRWLRNQRIASISSIRQTTSNPAKDVVETPLQFIDCCQHHYHIVPVSLTYPCYLVVHRRFCIQQQPRTPKNTLGQPIS